MSEATEAQRAASFARLLSAAFPDANEAAAAIQRFLACLTARATVVRRSANRFGGAERITLKVRIASGTSGPEALAAMKACAERVFNEAAVPPGAISVQAYTPGANLDHAADVGILELAPYGDWARANEAADGRVPRSDYGWRLVPMCEELEGLEVGQ